MSIKKIFNYSPNFNPKKRKVSEIKFLIFHYTGMKTESDAIKRLTNFKSQVSCHYLINKKGEVLFMVPDKYISWHAGKSNWKDYKSLNKNSIGIEISNTGHRFNCEKFSKKQIQSILKLSRYLIKKYQIKSQNILGHSDVAPSRKKDPGEKFPWAYFAKKKVGLWHSISNKKLKINREIKLDITGKYNFFLNLSKIGYLRKNYINLKNSKLKINIVKAFQRRFRSELINGKIDRECLIISEDLAKKFNKNS